MSPFDLQYSKHILDLRELYAPSRLYLYPYARYALYFLLKHLKVTSIYLPSFICRDLLAPINKLNIKYFFYEVNKKLKPKVLNVKADTVIAVNYFGFPQDIEIFEDYCCKNDAILIEDNAHGLFSKDSKGRLLGTRGDFGILSIRKTIGMPNGAALLVNNNKFYNVLFREAEISITEEDKKYKKKLIIKYLNNLLPMNIGISVLKMRRFMRKIKTGSALPLFSNENEYNLPKNDKLTPMLEDKIVKISLNDEVKRRRTMFNEIQNFLKEYNIQPLYLNLKKNIGPYAYPFYANETEVRKVEKFLFKKGYFILPWPDLPNDVMDNSPEFYKKLKMVPFLW